MINPFHACSMTHLAAALAQAMGIEAPNGSDTPVQYLADKLIAAMGGTAERVLLHNPDAIAAWLYGRYPEKFQKVMAHTHTVMPFACVMPSVTPVCFATMYTGMLPEGHGIRAYTKPQLTVDTLFDSLCRAGKRTAIVAQENSSIARIFLGREVDYFIVANDQEAVAKGLELLEKDEYECLCVYTCAYDDHIHGFLPESPEAMDALRLQVDSFDQLACAAEKIWADKRTLLACMTDHGVHYEQKTGGHGWYVPDDINVLHFFGGWGK